MFKSHDNLVSTEPITVTEDSPDEPKNAAKDAGEEASKSQKRTNQSDEETPKKRKK